MNDFDDLMKNVEEFGFNVKLDLNHYRGPDSEEIYFDGFEVRKGLRRLQFIRLEKNEVVISRGAEFPNEENNYDAWSLYYGPISQIPPILLQTLLKLFIHNSEDEIKHYYRTLMENK